jgi:hypothetical protein
MLNMVFLLHLSKWRSQTNMVSKMFDMSLAITVVVPVTLINMMSEILNMSSEIQQKSLIVSVLPPPPPNFLIFRELFAVYFSVKARIASRGGACFCFNNISELLLSGYMLFITNNQILTN